MDDLLGDVNAALIAAGLRESVWASEDDLHVRLSTLDGGSSQSLEITSRNTVAQDELGFVNDATAQGTDRIFRQNYSFYQTVGIERTVIDTRAGNDEVHGDGGYMFPGTGSEWGLREGDYQQRALAAALEIRGGEGADRLFGGPLDDTIDGGPGTDVILGGGGNDVIRGGGGDDLLVGNTAVVPDRFEWVLRDGSFYANDFAEYAADIGAARAGRVIEELSFHAGDPGDWYRIPAADAQFQFGDARRQHLTREMIRVDEIDELNNATPLDTYYLYAAESIGGNIVPVEKYFGVPDDYLLYVPNLAQSGRRYQVTFTDRVGKTIDVGPERGDYRVTPGDLGSVPTVVSLGDINNDGRADYIAALRGNLSDLLPEYDGTDGANFLAPSRAYVHFAADTIEDATLDENALILKLPAPVNATSAYGTKAVIGSPGDFNGDDIDDIAVAIYREGGAAGFQYQGVYLIFGQAGPWTGEVDVVEDADVVIRGTSGDLSVASAGDVTGDGIDDLLIADRAVGTVYLFHGRSVWSSLIGTTDLFAADFTSPEGLPSLDGFVLGGDPGLWGVTERRAGDIGHSGPHSLYYGTEENGNYNEGHTWGWITSPAIDLTEANEPQLAFNYFLETEGFPDKFDQATVEISTTGPTTGFQPLPQANNAQLLVDPTSVWMTAEFDLSAYVGRTVWIRFDFDTAGDFYNDFEGWYVDDFVVSDRTLFGIQDADLQFVVPMSKPLRAEGIGDFNGDTVDDMAIIRQASVGGEEKTLVSVYYGGLPLPAAPDVEFVSDATEFENFLVLPAGDVDADGYADLLITDAADTGSEDHLVFGAAALENLAAGPDGVLSVSADPATGEVELNDLLGHTGVVSVANGRLLGVGDLDGDGLDDLGAVTLEDSPMLTEPGTVRHTVGQVFLGAGGRDQIDLQRPDLVFEAALPNYETFQPDMFTAIGDVNSDGKADLAVADTAGGSVQVYLGLLGTNRSGRHGRRRPAGTRDDRLRDRRHTGPADGRHRRERHHGSDLLAIRGRPMADRCPLRPQPLDANPLGRRSGNDRPAFGDRSELDPTSGRHRFQRRRPRRPLAWRAFLRTVRCCRPERNGRPAVAWQVLSVLVACGPGGRSDAGSGRSVGHRRR